MKNIKSKVIVAMCIALLVMATGYAYFVTNLSITSTGNITSGWNVKFVSITEGNNGGTEATNASIPTYTDTTATMSVNLTSPGDYMEYEIVLQNTGDIDATIEEITTSEAGSDAIIFTVSGINDGDPLVKGDSKTIKVKIEYDPTITNQPTETTKTLTIGIKAVQIVNGNTGTNTPGSSAALLANKILQDNTAQADTAIDFGAISSDTNGKGLYYTSTNTEGNKTTYYFRGDVENNYVKFGKDSSGDDILWRIVRINEDGSIRIVTQDIVGSSSFNTEHGDNAYVGYMYGATGQSGNNGYNLTHANTTDSTMKDYLDDWYTANLSSYASKISNEAGFCNDRSIAPSAGLWYSNDTALGYAKNYTVYGVAGRLANLSNWTAKENAQPQFACPNESRDLFTMSSATKGNKKLTNPIGLLTADEVAYAGAVLNETNESMYLTNGDWYLTMSPSIFGVSHAIEWYVLGGAIASDGSVSNEGGARPVINLNSNVQLSTELPSGCTKLDGTKACPYIIKTN